MAIMRVEEISYGVADLANCRKFLQDWGLEELSASEQDVAFATGTHQILRLKHIGDPSLPPAVAEENCIRQIIWGVTSADDLDPIAHALETDRPVTRGDKGEVYTRDLTGFGIGFRVTDPRSVEVTPRLANTFGHTARLNQTLDRRGQAHPIRIIHVALDIPKEGAAEAIRFYIDRLGFKPVEEIAPTGCFLQTEGEIDHHQLFLCHRTNRPGINHVAFEVRDFDEIAEGGNYMSQRGWNEARRMGRHTVGSNVFRFYEAPMGGRVEYAADMDKVEKSVPPVYHAESPSHHLWILKGGEENPRH